MCEDFGANIIEIEYIPLVLHMADGNTKVNPVNSKISLNLKNKKISNFVLTKVIKNVDILIESYRPGVMERFGLGPEEVHKINPKLIYVRISGYGHNKKRGHITDEAGRDLNYLAASGLLSKFKRMEGKDAPTFPGNIISYYAGGSMFAFTLML